MSTVKNRCADEYAVMLSNIFAMQKVSASDFSGAIIASVVPPITGIAASAVTMLTGCQPLFVGPGIRTGLDIKIDRHSELGADIVANTVGAISMWEPPFVILDMGTATTLTAVNAAGELCGVVICPGMRISLDALSAGAAELPYIPLTAPKNLIGKNTSESMRSGIIYGTVCMTEGLIKGMAGEMGAEELKIIATGGLAPAVTPYFSANVIGAPDLILDGLNILYRLNKKVER